MPLPKLDVKTYRTTLPTSKKEVRFRSWTVKEDKILHMANSDDSDDVEMVDAIRQIITNCCLTELDIDNLPDIDMQYLFLQMRAKSVGEIVQQRWRCKNEVDGVECDQLMVIPLDLTKIQPKMPQTDRRVIQLSEKLGIKLRYPTFEIEKILAEITSEEDSIRLVANCLECVYDDETVHDRFTAAEAEEFLESIPLDKYAEINAFLEDLPVLQHTVHFKCKKCGQEDEILIEGLRDFFE